MRIGLISDVHANLPALTAVLDHLERARVDQVVCAGDVVGYGPHPEACLDLLTARDVPCVAGNHDLMAIGDLSDDRCVPLARRSQRWTRSVLSEAAVARLGLLPREHVVADVLVTHAALGDAQRYVQTAGEAAAQLETFGRRGTDQRILVSGHTHRQWLYSEAGGTLRRRRRGPTPLPAGRVLINPGSVGQSRQWEREPRARCAVVDLAAEQVWFSAVAYDWRRTRADLHRIGIAPEAAHAPPTAVGLYRRVRRHVEDRLGVRLPRRRPRRDPAPAAGPPPSGEKPVR